MSRTSLIASASAAAVLGSLVALGGASGALAADSPCGLARYERVQAKVDYTVYAPTMTFGLPRTGFQRNGCGGDRDDFITVNYGNQAALTDQSITLQESPGAFGCVDGPDGVGPAATFTVNGAAAEVMGACAGGKSTCSASSLALVRTVGLHGRHPAGLGEQADDDVRRGLQPGDVAGSDQGVRARPRPRDLTCSQDTGLD